MHCTTWTYPLAITDKWCGGNKEHTVVTWFHSGSGEMVQVSQRVIRVSHLNRVHKAGHVQAGRDTQGQRQDAEPRGQLHVTAPTPTPFTLGGLWLNPARPSSTMKKRKKKMNKHKWKKRKKALRMKSARGRER